MQWYELSKNLGSSTDNNTDYPNQKPPLTVVSSLTLRTAHPPAIKNHTATCFKGKLFVYGGYDGRRNRDALLVYDIQKERWFLPAPVSDSTTWVSNTQSTSGLSCGGCFVRGSPPPGQNGHTATLAVDPDDEGNGRIVIIGGWLGTGPLAAADTHCLDVTGPDGRYLHWHQPPLRGTPPGPCNMHSADYVRSKREVYVFRGGNGRRYLNDLHAFHVQKLSWRRVSTLFVL
jgi:leucine-zipper-like transcriptional regulator 1